ncbi:MAG TPA: sugar ABC transporter permease [Solirubrobacteraceae bacterium]|jgi:multiple sugar transport system permease protein|nr:sugar ABC transporter permease [Solirubrobacteraceae bacterium]
MAASDHLAGWAFVSPAVLLIAVFALIPIGWSLVLSLQANNLIAPAHYVGLANYKALSKDHAFRSAVGHTLLYTAIFVPISVVGALALAVALNRKIRGIRFYRLAVFVPLVTSTVATGIIFLWLLDPTFGLVNYILHLVGLPQQQFLQDPNEALYCIVAMTVWGWLGFDVIIYLAALQGIPADLLEASEMDGASRWATFRSVVVPLLGPATLFLVVWSTINALQLFDEIYVTTRGGPLGSTTVIVYYLYQQAFQFFNGGYGAAIAYVLFVAILLVTLVQLGIGRRRVHYSS